MNLMTFVQDERLRSRLAAVLDLSGAAGRAAAPVVDLLVRLALAKAFFAPGMFPGIGAANFPTVWPMIIVQVIGPVLMAIVLMVRPVALLMLVLTLRVQFSGAAQEEHCAASRLDSHFSRARAQEKAHGKGPFRGYFAGAASDAPQWGCHGDLRLCGAHDCRGEM
jgi:hypothetical protein